MPASFLFPRPVIGYESITVSSVAIGPTVATTQSVKASDTVAGAGDIFRIQAVEVLVTVETNPIRMRVDGTAPTSSEGHLFQPGDTFIVQGSQNIKNLKMIRTVSDATVKCTYFS